MSASATISVKGLVKKLSKYCQIEISDVNTPTSDKTIDIFYGLICQVYGESEILTLLRDLKCKPLGFSGQLYKFFNDLIPDLEPAFSLEDLIFPTKPRLMVFLNAFWTYLKAKEKCNKVRDELQGVENDLDLRLSKVKATFADLEETTEKAKLDREDRLTQFEKLDAQYIDLEAEFTSLRAETQHCKERVNKTRTELETSQQKIEELNSTSKKISDNIAFYEANILPPREEFEAELNKLVEQERHLKEVHKDKIKRMKQQTLQLNEKSNDASAIGVAIDMVKRVKVMKEANDQKIQEYGEALRELAIRDKEVVKRTQEAKTQLEIDISTSYEDVKDMSCQISDLKGEKAQMEMLLEKTSKDCRRSTKQLDALNSKIDKTTKAIGTEEEEFQSKVIHNEARLKGQVVRMLTKYRL